MLNLIYLNPKDTSLSDYPLTLLDAEEPILHMHKKIWFNELCLSLTFFYYSDSVIELSQNLVCPQNKFLNLNHDIIETLRSLEG